MIDRREGKAPDKMVHNHLRRISKAVSDLMVSAAASQRDSACVGVGRDLERRTRRSVAC